MSVYRTDEVESEIISVGTSRVLRLKRIGTTFLVENMQERRDVANHIEEQWKVVCSIRPDGKDTQKHEMSEAWIAAHQWLAQANINVLEMMQKDMARAAPRGADHGHA